MKQYIEIRKYSETTTPEVVKRIDVSDKTDRSIDKIDSGININLNHDEYYTRILCANKPLKIID